MNWLIIGAIVIIVVIFLNKMQNTRSNTNYYIGIAILLFFSVSLWYIDSKYDLDLSSFEGFVQVGRVYMSWGASLFHNVARIGGYAVNQDWSINVTNSTFVK